MEKLENVKKKKAQGKAVEKKTDEKKTNVEVDFNWTDDEIQLLLMSALDFKSSCEFEGIDWESKRTKYS